MILGLFNTPKSDGCLSVTTIDIGLNNDFDNWFRASGVSVSKTFIVEKIMQQNNYIVA